MDFNSFQTAVHRRQNGRLITLFLTLLLLLPFLSSTTTAASPAAAFTVNSTDDTSDGLCNPGHCSLREAILAANSLPGPDTILFTIPDSATIQLATDTQLPPITDDLTITGSGQTVAAGGQSRVFEIAPETAVSLSRLTIRDGSLIGQNGAGILNLGHLTITETTLTLNSSDSYDGLAGAIYNGSGRLDVIRSTFTLNTSGFGAASIWNESGTVFVENSTFSDNDTASGIGGIRSVRGTVIINHSTFYDNFSVGNSSYDIYNDDTALSLTNSILASGCENNNPLTLNVNNIIRDGACQAAFSSDPMLGPLQNYGGPTQTHTLMVGSPAVDNGHPGYCPDTDQRGVSRPDGPACDIGAFEGFYSPTAVSLTNLEGQNTPDSSNRLQPAALAALLSALIPIIFVLLRLHRRSQRNHSPQKQ